MKKLISAILAALMLVTCGISVFAADEASNVITKDSEPQTGKTEVYTLVEAEDVSYTVTIPADKQITWGDTVTTYNMNYTVTMQPDLGGKVKVNVTGDGYLYSDTDNTNKFAYEKVSGFKEQTFTVEATDKINNVLLPAESVTVRVPNWTGVPIAVYRAHLTYTVSYVPASIAP
ncbi:MAG: hypothetical protein J1F23_00750 [Oscillospiraceae bacterium]|nr:hypothetical protein [Oscillospiraceae bacterium]